VNGCNAWLADLWGFPLWKNRRSNGDVCPIFGFSRQAQDVGLRSNTLPALEMLNLKRMNTINSLNVVPGIPKAFGTGRSTLFPAANASSRMRRRDVLPLREAIPLCFALSSPLIGLIIGFMGAWFVTWLTL
jgi:hypothetical protein